MSDKATALSPSRWVWACIISFFSFSTGSGDSVLVGVEDNPDFKESLGGNERAFEGQMNPAFGRSIDDIAAPSPFSGGTRSNPLLDANFGDGKHCKTGKIDLLYWIYGYCELQGSFAK